VPNTLFVVWPKGEQKTGQIGRADLNFFVRRGLPQASPPANAGCCTIADGMPARASPID
jgi:hypothetical protein